MAGLSPLPRGRPIFMLAYVFWHWPQPSVAASDYEAKLRDFQAALADNKPPGFLHSALFRVKGANWLGGITDAYEEWYLVDTSAGLDPLNDAAVAPACLAVHDAAAQLAARGTAGLYRLRVGEGEPESARVAYWLTKPAGMKYEEFYAALKPQTSQAGAALWGRQMTLGPTPEFCLHTRELVELPAGIASQMTALERLWP